MAVTSKEAVLANSQFLNGLNVQAAQEKILIKINQQNIVVIILPTPPKPTSSILPKSIGTIVYLVVNLSAI